jgi:MoxR-like ATPase
MNDKLNDLIDGLDSILIGKNDKVKKIVACILIGGNILLDDVPGVGKTVISKSLSRLISSGKTARGIKFSRIQGTPDLLPYDITGVDVYDPEKKEFTFKPGPVFADILLADELNRTTPKVQSALLQAMAEKQVTIGNKTYQLPEIFFVIATQNPVESEGTYPLPAAQLDRFTVCLNIGYPDFDHELDILKRGKSEDRLSALKPVISTNEILAVREEIKNIEVNEKILNAITSICHKTREFKDIKLGLSTRAALMMTDILRSNAYINDRDYVTDQDVIDLAEDVWAHRFILLNPHLKAGELINRIAREEVRKIMKV